MMSSRRAAPHQGSGWLTAPTQEAEYMAATEPPINIEQQAALASGLGPYMTEQEIEQDRNCHYDLQSSIGSGQPSAITCAITVDAVWLRLKCKFAILRRRANSAVFP